MGDPKFKPGFRFSTLDFFVLVFGFITASDAAAMIFCPGLAMPLLLANYFLFCNFIRMARLRELVWAAIFVAWSTSTIVIGSPSWPATLAFSFVATIVLVTLEVRGPSYHGIYWHKINPDLPNWWDNNAL